MNLSLDSTTYNNSYLEFSNSYVLGSVHHLLKSLQKLSMDGAIIFIILTLQMGSQRHREVN